MMRITIFDTPLLNTLMFLISSLILKIFGWKKRGVLPDIPKYVIIAAPHTTNWDLPLTLFFAFAFRMKVYWMGKDRIFKKPFGTIMRWLGGIPVDRKRSQNLVETSINIFKKKDKIVMIIPPEGTRNQVNCWKSGFYHIAAGAGVPIVMGFLDYKKKIGGIGPIMYPTGEFDSDITRIQEFYKKVTPLYPQRTSWHALSRVEVQS